MPGRSLRAGIREELQRAANNADSICSHLIRIGEICVEGKRADLKEKFGGINALVVTLKDLLISLRETL